MKIRPSAQNFSQWLHCVPAHGDLLFLDDLADQWDLPVPVLTVREVNDRAAELWSLNMRSWYRYSLSRVQFVAWLPVGTFERLSRKTRVRVLKKHRQLGLKSMTSQSWTTLSREEKLRYLQKWYRTFGDGKYEKFPVKKISQPAWKTLREIGLAKLVASFPNHSGPNCFALVLACVSQDASLADQWLHWPSLERFLTQNSYRCTAATPSAGDVLVFFQKEAVVHAAFAISPDYYFEKPGQDFYEPYRVVRWKDRLLDWPKTQVRIYHFNAG